MLKPFCLILSATALALTGFGIPGLPIESAAHANEPAVPGPSTMELSLAQAIDQVLRNNPRLVAERLDRTLQEYDLNVAEGRFVPEFSSGTVKTDYVVDKLTGVTTYRLSAGPLVSMRLPSGSATLRRAASLAEKSSMH